LPNIGFPPCCFASAHMKRGRALGAFVPGRGGSRQRQAAAARAAEDAAPIKQGSSLVAFLMSLWCWGLMPASTMQTIMLKFEKDLALAKEGRLDEKHIHVLAALGTYGAHPNNINAELMRIVNSPFDSSCVSAPVPMRTKLRSFAVSVRSQLFVLPHMLFAKMFSETKVAFQERVSGPPGRIQSFWDEVKATSLFKRHPVQYRRDFSTKAIPISLHGDGVPITGIGKSWGRSADCFSWASLVGGGSTIDVYFYIYSVMGSLLTADGSTMSRVWDIMCWSLHALWLGKWPYTNWDGNPFAEGSVDAARAGTELAEGFFCTMWAIRGDLEYYGKVLKLNWYMSSSPCSFCNCNTTPNSPMAWSEFRPGICEWADRVLTDEQWRLARPNLHPLFMLPGVGIDNVICDWMHSKHLGTDMYIFGSILHILCYAILTGSNQDANQSKLYTTGEMPSLRLQGCIA
jgi:hypothetical protein